MRSRCKCGKRVTKKGRRVIPQASSLMPHACIKFECEIPMVKLLRAHGGCLGIERRRKAWKSAKSLGEPTNR
jgi:hypothetical protein